MNIFRSWQTYSLDEADADDGSEKHVENVHGRG